MIIMESLSFVLSSSPPIQNHPKPLKTTTAKPNSLQCYFLSSNKCLKNPFLTKTTLSFTTSQFFTSLPSLASETLPNPPEPVSDKINLETILVSIDEFLTRYPFFVFTCAFIWLIGIPLVDQYLKKYKFASAINAFRKLRDNPDAQLLDIRDKKSVVALETPNLKLLNKSAVHVEFSEGDEDGFLKQVLENFQDPSNTILCILDNFDGNSMRVAELLINNGFKEAYAIKGGVRGKDGWLAIQDNLLPPSIHMYRKKKAAKSSQLGTTEGAAQRSTEDKIDTSSSPGPPAGESRGAENGHVNLSANSRSRTKLDCRSPYPNYPDLKPPSSPTPSKP